VLVLEAVGASEAGRVADVVGNHDGWIKGLEIEDDDGRGEEGRLRFEDERDALGAGLLTDLRTTGEERESVIEVA
jgi:hypothetical protein